MISKLNRMLIAATVAIGMSSAHALSISVSPADQVVSPGATQATVALLMDFGTTRAVGGQILIDLSDALSVASFTPSAFFNSLVSGGGHHGLTFLSPPDAEYEVTMISPTVPCPPAGQACPSDITGSQTLGTLTLNLLNLGAQHPGIITLSEGDGFGGRAESFAEDFTGADLAIDFTGGTVSAVPLPATAWLFSTAFGLVGFWRRRR